jgi:hypothetical protein
MTTPGCILTEPTGHAKANWIGTPSQIQWAEQIKPRVDAEFDRVASALKIAGGAQADEIIAILEEKRTEVMANQHAGYFIRDWQELTDQVREMIRKDARYVAIQAKKAMPR